MLASLLVFLTVVLVILKVASVIAISWWLVFTPLFIVVFIQILVIGALIGAFRAFGRY